jgi:glycosyltransferase involved in cell wall biosynthesis
MVTETRILFIYSRLLPFIEKDLALLREEFEAIPFEYSGKKDIPRLLKLVLSSDINISWFCMGYATSAVFFSKIMGRKSLVIAGGWDVVSMPEIGYGSMTNDRSVKKTSYALKYADVVVAVSESTKEWVQKWVKRTDIRTIYHGFDADLFEYGSEKERLVVTVGSLVNDVTIRVKGLETLFRTAELLPDIRFVIIGGHDPQIASKWRTRAPANLEILDFMPQSKLIEFYKRAKIYAQLSYQESFGCGVAEAMLCGCMPVVTRTGALPEVVGETGFYVDYDDAEGTAKTLEHVMNLDKGMEARERIMTLFPHHKRKDRLFKLIDEMLRGG